LIREKPIENPSKVIGQENLKRKEHSTSNRTSDIKCFKCLGRGHVKSQCPSMRTILMKAQDVYSSEEEKHEDSTSEESECEGCEDVYAHEGKLLGEPSPINLFYKLSHRERTFFTLDVKFFKMYVLSLLTTVRVVIVAVIGWLKN